MSLAQDMESMLPKSKELSNGVVASGSLSSALQIDPQAIHNPEMEEIMPIAIVGMSCRLPGSSSNPEKLWKMLSQGRSGWTNVPEDRFKQTSFYHPKRGTKGTVSPMILASFPFHLPALTGKISLMRKGPISSTTMSPNLTHHFSTLPQKRPR